MASWFKLTRLRGRSTSHQEQTEALWDRAGLGAGRGADEAARLESITAELDRSYALLHQREARRAAGLDPDEADVRPAEVVERYQQ